MCPLLTAGVMQDTPADPDNTPIPGAAQTLNAMQCQGEVCAFYVPLADESGRRTGDGNCAVPLSAIALSQISVNVSRAMNKGPKIVKG